MVCFGRIALAQSATAGALLQAGMNHAAQAAMLESLMKVADLPKLIFDPTSCDSLCVLPHSRGREIVALHRVESCFGRQHAALDGKMNALEPMRVKQAGGVASDHPAIASQSWQRPPSPVGKSLGAVTDHFAAG